MVHFNELRITSDFKHLIIDVSVLSDSYYDNVYIDSVAIDNQDTYVGNGASSTPVYSYSAPENHKHIRLTLDYTDLKSLDNLFFVYVRTKGAPAADTPCGMDNITTLGTVCNMYPFYRQAMSYISEMADNCSIPQSFTDYILKLKALELSVKTGNYTDAIKYYNKFFKGSPYIKIGGCGCGNL